MQNKDILRKKYFIVRKKKYFDIKPSFFNPLIKLIKQKYSKKTINVSIYYPASFEANVLKLFEAEIISKLKILLPVLKKNNEMQLSFISLDDPLIEELKQEILKIDIDNLKPLDALVVLNKLKKKLDNG